MIRWDQPGLYWDAPGLTYDAPDSSNLQPTIPMAKDQTKRLRPVIVQTDKDVLAAIATLSPAYAPADPQYSVANLTASQTGMLNSQNTEVQKLGEAAAARDAANAAEWAFHNKIQGAKLQVMAQYGADSDQLQAIGLKKKSERKKPSRKPAP